jgi:GNAT superfamily N-acetyltransferase
MKRLRGPLHQFGEMWGLQIDAFDRPPVFMSPYNHPYYPGFMEDFGLRKAKDLLVYEADRAHGYEIPERFRRFTETFLKRHPRFTLRRFNPSRLMEDAVHINTINNEAVTGNWGFVPYDEAEFKDMVKALKILIDPDAIWFVMDNGKPVGFCLGFPDVNVISRRTNGRLFPTGFLHVLLGRKKIKNYRLFGLAVLPPYHGLGLDVLLYLHLAQALSPKGIRLEANYILEDNFKIRNALEKLKLKRVKTYRVYEKEI